MPKTVLDHYSYGKALVELDNTRKELERWKTMAQRHNPSGCCCQFDENNGDPKMVKPCAFHAEWRDKELEALREKVQAVRDFDCGAWLKTDQHGFEKRTELMRLLDALYGVALRAAVEKGLEMKTEKQYDKIYDKLYRLRHDVLDYRLQESNNPNKLAMEIHRLNITNRLNWLLRQFKKPKT